ncbi:MAG: hypothetical protein KAR38_09465 [Calditrichia bacterium]|nr:hypothetical protein [Calditrichia bacterium]
MYSGELEKGENYFTWNGKDESGKDIPSGIYYLHLSNDKFRAQTKKMLYLK